jgi:hypothetical protein
MFPGVLPDSGLTPSTVADALLSGNAAFHLLDVT